MEHPTKAREIGLNPRKDMLSVFVKQFSKLDINGNGKIDEDEFLARFGFGPFADPELQVRMDRLKYEAKKSPRARRARS